jgi:hypothetical protein
MKWITNRKGRGYVSGPFDIAVSTTWGQCINTTALLLNATPQILQTLRFGGFDLGSSRRPAQHISRL